jgi:hypothetical protein
VCVEVAAAHSETTDEGSENRFVLASAALGSILSVGAGESSGSISESNSQESRGSSQVVGSTLMGGALADVAQSSTRSFDEDGGASEQENSSQVIGLLGNPLLIETDEGTLAVPLIATIVFNADDTNGEGEAVEQAEAPYGVREALSAFVLPTGPNTALVQARTAASESRAADPGDDDGDGGDGGGGDGGNGGNGDGNGNGNGDGNGADAGPAAFTGPLGPLAETPGARRAPRGTPRRRGAPRRPGTPRGGGPGGPGDGPGGPGDGPDRPDAGRLVSVADAGARAGEGRGAEALARTGLEAWLIALLGALLLAGGLALRRGERAGARS